MCVVSWSINCMKHARKQLLPIVLVYRHAFILINPQKVKIPKKTGNDVYRAGDNQAYLVTAGISV